MMTDNLIFGEPTLLPAPDSPMAVGAYVGNELGDGGGGPTDGERTIEAIFLDYSSPPTYQDLWESHHQNGAMFYDSDQNGYFDVLQRVDDSGVWNYNPETGDWNRKPFSESKDADNKSP